MCSPTPVATIHKDSLAEIVWLWTLVSPSMVQFEVLHQNLYVYDEGRRAQSSSLRWRVLHLPVFRFDQVLRRRRRGSGTTRKPHQYWCVCDHEGTFNQNQQHLPHTCKESNHRIESSQPRNSFKRWHGPPFDLLTYKKTRGLHRRAALLQKTPLTSENSIRTLKRFEWKSDVTLKTHKVKWLLLVCASNSVRTMWVLYTSRSRRALLDPHCTTQG